MDIISEICVNGLSFSYDTSFEDIFNNVSFTIDTDWKLGFIGRNGRGKTTFLKLLLGEYQYRGSITKSVSFDYFPYMVVNENENSLKVIRNIIAPFELWENQMKEFEGNTEKLLEYGDILENYMYHDGFIIDTLIEKEASKLQLDIAILQRQFNTLSSGEKTKLLIAALFLKKNNFLLIDEPTNHLDIYGRQVVANYLSKKNGFILVSHDRAFLDSVVDHVLSINKSNIEIQKGNYSSWKLNKDRIDSFELGESEKLKKEIIRLKEAAKKKAEWAEKSEGAKFGDGSVDRGYIGHKSAKMMKRVKCIENRQNKAIDEKSKLLKNIENTEELKIHQLEYSKNTLIDVVNLSIRYNTTTLFNNLNFSVNVGERVLIRGKNGCGKSSIIKLLLGYKVSYSGNVYIGSGISISYVPQDTSFLKGNLNEFSRIEKLDESLFKSILRKLDFTRSQFDKDLLEYSEGQKKKVLIAKSLSQQAHIFIWDEPLNFIDVISRVQIESLLLNYKPTMIFIEHDKIFGENISTKIVDIK